MAVPHERFERSRRRIPFEPVASAGHLRKMFRTGVEKVPEVASLRVAAEILASGTAEGLVEQVPFPLDFLLRLPRGLRFREFGRRGRAGLHFGKQPFGEASGAVPLRFGLGEGLRNFFFRPSLPRFRGIGIVH